MSIFFLEISALKFNILIQTFDNKNYKLLLKNNKKVQILLFCLIKLSIFVVSNLLLYKIYKKMKRIASIKYVLFFVILLCFTRTNAQTFVRAAQDGDANAQYKLGKMYSQDGKMQKDIKKAIYWYKKAAEQNQKDAIMALGDIYYYGTDVNQNVHLAFTYYKQASELGNYEADFSLGEMYAQGVGVAKHLPSAFEYYKKAADKGGLAKAMFKTGTMLFEGKGVKQDKAQGINYIKLAFNEGYPTALEYWNENQLWQYEE